MQTQKGSESGSLEIPIQDQSPLDNKIFLTNLTEGLEDQDWKLTESRVAGQVGP